MADGAALVWLRQDLRLSDNPALAAAVAGKRPLVLAYILDDEAPWRPGGASRWWLHHSVAALDNALQERGGALVLRRGRAADEMLKLAAECDARAAYWNRTYEPHAVARDAALKQTLRARGVEAHSSNGALLFEPWEVKTKSGEPYKVFTPFWRACLAGARVRAPLPAPERPAFAPAPRSEALADWRLTPTRPNWARGFAEHWRPGEAGARTALTGFIDDKLAAYASARDQLGEMGSSRLSPHLHFGEISPVQLYAAIEGAALERPALRAAADKYLSEVGWREFSHHLLFHWPKLPEANWRAEFDAFPWRTDAADLKAWRTGRTGYPVVDAAMRELWATGYMHNRARMIAASFLIKHLLIDWRCGADWFWDTLADADLANNSASWQWVAGSGADASPYFRIFNPVTQGRRYDQSGAYVRRWIPELSRLPDARLHAPWECDEAELRAAGVVLGNTYPRPIVDHGAARERALAAFATL